MSEDVTATEREDEASPGRFVLCGDGVTDEESDSLLAFLNLIKRHPFTAREVEGLRLERQHRWEWPPVPEGWRACDNQTLDDDGRLWRTITDAPRDESPFNRKHEWVEARRINQKRWVTPWETTDA